MSLTLRAPTRAGRIGRSARRSISVAVPVLVVLLVILGGLSVLGTAPRPTMPASASSLTPTAYPLSHGDLVVLPGQTVVIQPPVGSQVYYQGGNITVESGGTLIVRNTTISFVQFVADNGMPEQRLSHIDHFVDNGTVNLYNSTVTTDVQVINAYAKLNLTVDRAMTAWNSTFAFPGWINVEGASADLTLNASSHVIANPLVPNLIEPSVLIGDTRFAPSISVTDGAQLDAFNSAFSDTYADNTVVNGQPQPLPLSINETTLAPGTRNITHLWTPTGSVALAQDWLYPNGNFQVGDLTVNWTNSNTTIPAQAVVDLWYNGVEYPVPPLLTFTNASSGAYTIPLPTALLQAISHDGLLSYLNSTGDFGTGPSRIAVQFVISGIAVNISAELSILPSLDYNIMVSGVDSTLNSVDSSFDLDWTALPANSTSHTAPYPWDSNKLLLTDGAMAYLANATIPNSIPEVFSTSAVLPDGTSQAFFFRWAQFNLTGRGGLLVIQGAKVSASYAYNGTSIPQDAQTNATVNTLNDLATSNPEIWGYVQYWWDPQHGVASYGSSNATGVASVLLASSGVTFPTLPDGEYLGDYHMGISVPAIGVESHWFNWSVSPYPTGVALGSEHYNGPDFGPTQHYPDYYGAVNVSSVSILANGVADTTVDIGQVLGVHVAATDNGTATITQIGADLYYNNSSLSTPLAKVNFTNLDLSAPGQQVTFTLNWTVSETITGLHGWFKHNLTLVLEWNDNKSSRAGGNLTRNVSLTFAPSEIAFGSFALPPTTLDLSQTYFSTGTLEYNGTHAATIELFATPVGGGSPVEIAAASTLPGNFTLQWPSPLSQLTPGLVPGTSYTLTATAIYNGRQTNDSLPGTYAVPPTPTSSTNFFLQKFLGLPLWAWLAIAAAAAIAIVLFLFVVRRQAAGKLVECGECGNLIPEDATVCPKCGAEFETDLIRCSRCASTIPADSKSCPECAAQLLGTPGEAESDPEKQAYADFTEKYRAEAKRELGDNYSEGAFWDWWKRQPTYTPFSQWSLQQGQGTARAGMTAPPTGTETTPEGKAAAGQTPPKGGPGWVEGPPAGAVASTPAAPTGVPPPAPAGAGLKACPSCGKEIPSEYLVCPFCNAVTS